MEDIEYKLRFLLNSMTLTVDKVQTADTTQMNHLQFLKKYKNQKIIHAFIKQAPAADTPISTPLLGVPINPEDTSHKLLYCKIAVGASLFTSSEYAMNCKTPHGYDSFIISNNPEVIESVISTYKKSKSLASYTYIVPDISRVLVIAEVHFTYDKKLEDKSKNNDHCEYCNDKPAISFCIAERAAFCGDCDKYFHSNAFTQRHAVHYFKQVGKKRFLHCKDHKTVVIDYFCMDCTMPVCIQCRITSTNVSHHSHRMVSYIEACDDLKSKVTECTDMDIVMKRAESAITQIDQEISGFEGEIECIKGKLQYEYDTSMSMLNDLVKRRYQRINAKYFESKYLMEIADRAVKYPREVDPSVLVEKWKAIQDMNRSISEIVLEDIGKYSKIIVKGGLSVEMVNSCEVSPNSVSTVPEDDLVRKRTEMLLRVSQFKTSE
ncbi:hypothetical protein NEPAR06_0558 [Nematocida parisii]|uniref:B box-type domain-containing protein n=1 Tax=Nematocida parisii (strain ERTm3) TaxID=935791 RepID=I3EI80_NEMP3|nr:hypothetical protein NEQG_00746 [Nematocida parisii ERTm3]KAI5143706.1 hypothetical protein NEPAR07_0804 [Nematocida parisii]KAI5153564.1 hypothetical protein NEPAR06_0558 [Nematocida parisii]KAI5156468.1 hypothetical protein NEPAR05_0598 [Nematocida parisii]